MLKTKTEKEKSILCRAMKAVKAAGDCVCEFVCVCVCARACVCVLYIELRKH